MINLRILMIEELSTTAAAAKTLFKFFKDKFT